MINLFVSYDADEWKDSGKYVLEKSRFLEYTEESILSKFNSESLLTSEQINALMSLPCVFMSEDFSGPTKIGSLTNIEQRGRYLHIDYITDPAITLNGDTLDESLQLFGWEISRTHWAIKEIDISELIKTYGPVVLDKAALAAAVTGEDLDLLPTAEPPEAKPIHSVSEFIAAVLGIEEAGKEIFYRGHSNRSSYKLAPSLFRKKKDGKLPHLPVEDRLYRELLVANSKDFRDDTTTLDKLVRMQHFGLPTRLLDITSNPLIALYFACKTEKYRDDEGEVIVFSVDDNRVKYFDSDTASCVANLVHLPLKDKEQINFEIVDKEKFNGQDVIKRLLHFIKGEKSYFEPNIIKEDLKSIICVKGKRSNDRIHSQSGAFLLFGQDANFTEGGMPEIGIGVQRFAITNKKRILNELDKLNINESTVFPYIESSAKYISGRLEQS